MKVHSRVLWRCTAAFFWILSLGCLAKAIRDGATAEEFRSKATVSETQRGATPQLSVVADRWADAGWVMQVVTVALLALGIDTQRVVRRIFVSLEVLIAADGLMLLLTAVIVR